MRPSCWAAAASLAFALEDNRRRVSFSIAQSLVPLYGINETNGDYWSVVTWHAEVCKSKLIWRSSQTDQSRSITTTWTIKNIHKVCDGSFEATYQIPSKSRFPNVSDQDFWNHNFWTFPKTSKKWKMHPLITQQRANESKRFNDSSSIRVSVCQVKWWMAGEHCCVLSRRKNDWCPFQDLGV